MPQRSAKCTVIVRSAIPCDVLGVPKWSGKRKEHKDLLFGSGACPVGWGSSTRRGGGRKVRALPRKFVFLGFREEESGMSRAFCRDIPDPWGCSKSLSKKSSCAFFLGPKILCAEIPCDPHFAQDGKTLKTLSSLNKESRPSFLGDHSIRSFPYVSSLSDYSPAKLKLRELFSAHQCLSTYHSQQNRYIPQVSLGELPSYSKLLPL